MLKDMVVAISGGVGRLGTAFSTEIINNGGKVIIGDVNEKNGKNIDNTKSNIFIVLI